MPVSRNADELKAILKDRATRASLLAAETAITLFEPFVFVDTTNLRRSAEAEGLKDGDAQIEYSAEYAVFQYFGNYKHLMKGAEPSKISSAAGKSPKGGSSERARYSRGYRKLKENGSLTVAPNMGKWARTAIQVPSVLKAIQNVYQGVFSASR